MKPTSFIKIFSFPLMILIMAACDSGTIQRNIISVTYPLKSIEINAEEAVSMAQRIRQEVAVELAEQFVLDLWASDTLVQDPIAISIDDAGKIYYTRASRQRNSEFDIRGHRDWMTASISWETVEDRRHFLKETFSADSEQSRRFLQNLNQDSVLDWRDLAVEEEQVWFVADKNGDGVADMTQLYLQDFADEVTDVANGVEVFGNQVFIAAAPDFWRTEDTDGNGVADLKESLSHGFAVHIGFSGHGMSGPKVGPDGRIWWGIGDIGMNVVDKNGNKWEYPNQGVIVRSEMDGSGFEVYSRGLRNTHEFDFDKYGNLITEDNDGDHRGERERLLYLINGSDTGWRSNWQYGKYIDPENNGYNVWMDEGMSVPRWDKQAAYILPPITNYVNGPTGLVYNPGTALSEKYYDHFFVAEFRGTPARSPIHAFRLKPDGASFALDKTEQIVSGLLPTGLDFGADGALYFGDWINGWGLKDEGRIWKLDIADAANAEIRKETQTLLQSDFKQKNDKELKSLLAHQDMRVRQRAQFTLADKGNLSVFVETAKAESPQLARVHSLWGIAQIARKKSRHGKELLPYVKDSDVEIIAQAAKMLGDIRYKAAGRELIPLLKHQSLRVRLMATEALGRIEDKTAIQPIIEMLESNNDKDAWLRHAGVIALERIGQEDPLISLSAHPSRALRTAAVIALRRLRSPGIEKFLDDNDEYVLAEVARAINDDRSIPEALPGLARLLDRDGISNEVILRRAINANIRVGEAENIELLTAYLTKENAPVTMQADALQALSTWGSPSVLDRVDGRFRGGVERDSTPVIAALEPIIKDLLFHNSPTIQVAAAGAVSKLKLDKVASDLYTLFEESESADVRKAALQAMSSVEAQDLDEALKKAFKDKNNSVRALALEILPESNISQETAVDLFKQILKKGSSIEKQATFAALGTMKGKEVRKLLSGSLKDLSKGKIDRKVQLDVIEAIEAINHPDLNGELTAYYAAKPQADSVAKYRETLYGGNARNGDRLFYLHQGAQCIRCHAIFERGGNVGPGLAGVGSRLSREQILESMVHPSGELALGYEIVVLTMKDGETITGTLMNESSSELTLTISKGNIQKVSKAQIAERKSVPSSMPAMGGILTKGELRDIVEYLASIKDKA